MHLWNQMHAPNLYFAACSNRKPPGTIPEHALAALNLLARVLFGRIAQGFKFIHCCSTLFGRLCRGFLLGQRLAKIRCRACRLAQIIREIGTQGRNARARASRQQKRGQTSKNNQPDAPPAGLVPSDTINHISLQRHILTLRKAALRLQCGRRKVEQDQ